MYRAMGAPDPAERLAKELRMNCPNCVAWGYRWCGSSGFRDAPRHRFF
jgi:hypothetical protein